MADQARQAVVVVHGVGEQQPTQTLRGFVLSVLHELRRRNEAVTDEGEPRFYSRVDPLSTLMELRQIAVPGTRSRPVTHFYELYWAHEMRETTWAHVVRWFRSLLLRWRYLPPRLRGVWMLVVLLLLLTVPGVYFVSRQLGQLPAAATLVAELVVTGLATRYVLNYAGDAARYLRPHADNIDPRRRIRSAGVELLRELHRSDYGYERIVLVGHSLGSVIAYDILRHLWAELHRTHDSPWDASREALDEMDAALAEPEPTEEWRRRFRKHQHDLFVEQRSLGNEWLISDLVTLGSPIAHASYLIANDEAELRRRIDERELPCCPPVLDEGSVRSHEHERYETSGQKRSLPVLHEAALFAVTRWTNLYYPGDIIGGPIEELGEGVENHELKPARAKLWARLPHTHTRYWRARAPWSGHALAEGEAMRQLVDAMALGSRRWLGEVRERRRRRVRPAEPPSAQALDE